MTMLFRRVWIALHVRYYFYVSQLRSNCLCLVVLTLPVKYCNVLHALWSHLELLLAGYTESNSGLPIKDMLEKNIGKTNGAGSSADAD